MATTQVTTTPLMRRTELLNFHLKRLSSIANGERTWADVLRSLDVDLTSILPMQEALLVASQRFVNRSDFAHVIKHRDDVGGWGDC